MTIKSILSIILGLFLISEINGQTQNHNIVRDFQKIKGLYAGNSWNTTYLMANQFLINHTDSHHTNEVAMLKSLSALKLNISGAETLAILTIGQIQNIKIKSEIILELGNFYFGKKQYKKATTYYGRGKKGLSKKKYEYAKFMAGYCFFFLGDYDSAEGLLHEVMEMETDHDAKAAYYLGIINYKKENWMTALDFFMMGKELDNYNSIVYVADIYNKTDQKADLIAFAESELPYAASNDRKILLRLLGSAHFDLGHFGKVIFYLEQLVKESDQKAMATIYFQLGTAHDQLRQYDKAINTYKIAALENSELGQLTSFRLGELYVRLGNFQYASQAYQKASGTTFNLTITEKSAFQSGKVKYQEEQYDESVNLFSQFIEQFPESIYSEEATELLSNSWLRTSNYDRVLEYLDSSGTLTTKQGDVYQKAAFAKGLHSFDDQDYESAVRWFEKCTKIGHDHELEDQSQYLLGEVYSLINDHEKSENAYLKVSFEKNEIGRKSLYGLAYLYFNQSEWAKAQYYFEKFLGEATTSNLYWDAKIRLADCFYIKKIYNQASRVYREALEAPINGEQEAHIYYQLGTISYYFKKPRECDLLLSVVLDQFPNTSYADRAALQIGQAWLEAENFLKAEESFSLFLNRFPRSIYYPNGLLKRALCLFNLSMYTKAYEDYKTILTTYPNHETAKDVLQGLQDLRKYIAPEKLNSLLSLYKNTDPGDSNLEKIEFDLVKSAFFDQHYGSVHDNAKTFIKNHPQSQYLQDVFFYDANSYAVEGKDEKAVSLFDQLLYDSKSQYFHRTLDKRGKLLLKTGQWLKAISNYHLLRINSRSPKELYLSIEGLMLAHENEYPDSAYFYAKEILNGDYLPINGGIKAEMVCMRVKYKNKEWEDVISIADGILKSTNQEEAAACMYIKASVYSETGDLEKSNNTIFELFKIFPSYRKWTNQGYLLLIDNYIKLNELLQAEATINSILKNSEEDQLIRSAKTRLLEIDSLSNIVLDLDSMGILKIDSL